MFRIEVLENFKLGDNHLGKAVFSNRKFKIGDVITQFKGSIVSKNNLPLNPLVGENDRYMQISEDMFLGPSFEMDDYINHSCDPNAGVLFKKFGVILIAIKPIKIGDEITWDYSTTIYNDSWQMTCACKTSSCRSIVKEFKELPSEIKNKYISLGIVPDYIKQHYENK